MGIDVLNIKKIRKNIEEKNKEISKSTIESLIEIGEEGVRIIKLNTPTDTGRLKLSMGYTINSKVITPETPRESEDKLQNNIKKDVVVLGTNVVYAPKIEFVPSKSTANLGFMARSFKQLKPVATRIFKEVLRGAVKK